MKKQYGNPDSHPFFHSKLSSTCQCARMMRRGDESDVIFCFSFSTRHAITERIFLIIHNFRIFHLNNLKFSVKLLCTYMNNFPTGSFYRLSLPRQFLSPKLEKYELWRESICYQTSINNRLFNFFNRSHWPKWYFLRVS